MPCYVLWFVSLGLWKPILIVVTSGRTCIIYGEASSILLDLTTRRTRKEDAWAEYDEHLWYLVLRSFEVSAKDSKIRFCLLVYSLNANS